MNKKNIISLLVLAILAVAIPLGLNLARQQQTLKSSATEAPITFSGDNAEQRNGVWVVKDRTKPVTVTFTSPLGPPPVATGPAILRSVQSPIKKKVSFSFPSLVKEVYAQTGTCRDNPVTPPSGFKWKATCGGSSCYNGGNNDRCPRNTFDSANVRASDSNWCYGFEGPAGSSEDFRCLMYVRNGCETAGASGCAPAPTCESACTWTRRGCGENGCSQGERSYTATCTIGGCTTSRCESDSSCGSTGGGSCSVSWSISSNQAAPNTNVSVTVTGENSSVSGGWSDIGLSIDNGASVGDAQITPGSRPRFTYTVGSGAQPRTNTLTFSLKNGAKVCTPTGSFTTTGTTPTPTSTSAPAQSCSITGDFDGNGQITLADYEIWKNAFINGNPISRPANAPLWNCENVTVDLVLFNTWRTQYSRQ